MTSTIRKRAERLRRKEAGEVRVECWVTEKVGAKLDTFCAQKRCASRGKALELLLELYL